MTTEQPNSGTATPNIKEIWQENKSRLKDNMYQMTVPDLDFEDGKVDEMINRYILKLEQSK